MTTAIAHTSLIEHLTPRYGLGEASSIARIVMEDVFQVRNKSADRSLALEEIHRFSDIRSRLVAGEPVQYILEEADFWGLKFKVSPAVLIPRQETEELVAWVLEFLKKEALAAPKVLDIGLGSGCIGITLKKKYSPLQLYGLEKSPAALETAMENGIRHLSSVIRCAVREPEGIQAHGSDSDRPSVFIEGDILEPATWAVLPRLEVVVSNPPYIPIREKNNMPEHVLAHEPALALFVEDHDPLLFYRAIAQFCAEKLLPGGALFLECNEFNAQQVGALLREHAFESVELRKDLAGAERMVSARLAAV